MVETAMRRGAGTPANLPLRGNCYCVLSSFTKSAIRNPQSAIRNSKRIYSLSADKVCEAFTLSNHLHASFVDNRFGSARAGIIVGGKNHPIRAGAHHSQQVPFLWYL